MYDRWYGKEGWGGAAAGGDGIGVGAEEEGLFKVSGSTLYTCSVFIAVIFFVAFSAFIKSIDMKFR